MDDGTATDSAWEAPADTRLELLPAKIRPLIAQCSSGCWEWMGGRDKLGYGYCCTGGGVVQAHRLVYAAVMGPVAEGMVLDHLCRNKPCCNPAHLEVVGRGENTRRRHEARRDGLPTPQPEHPWPPVRAVVPLRGEVWRAVPQYEGLYEVSNLGRLRSLPRATTRGRLLKQRVIVGKYLGTALSQEGREVNRLTHHLVAAAFLGSRPEGADVRHLDGNAANNCADNLAYGTHAENMRDMVQHGTNAMLARTHCPQGHPYDEANTYFTPTGGRRCRACILVRTREYRQANRDRLNAARRRLRERRRGDPVPSRQ